jgi:hypothetical protein
VPVTVPNQRECLPVKHQHKYVSISITGVYIIVSKQDGVHNYELSLGEGMPRSFHISTKAAQMTKQMLLTSWLLHCG